MAASNSGVLAELESEFTHARLTSTTTLPTRGAVTHRAARVNASFWGLLAALAGSRRSFSTL